MKVWLYSEYYVSENLLSEEYRFIILDRKTDEILLRIKVENEQQEQEILCLLENNEDVFQFYLDRYF